MLEKLENKLDNLENKISDFVEDHPMIAWGCLWGSYLVVCGFAVKKYSDDVKSNKALIRTLREASEAIRNTDL